MKDFNEKVISQALEDYIKAIYFFSQKKASVRITDIAQYLGLSKPSVNRAVNSLKNQGYVMHEPYGDVILTEKGAELGYSLMNRHKLIKKFLVDVLDIPCEYAENEARKMEYSVSKITVDKMASYMEA